MILIKNGGERMAEITLTKENFDSVISGSDMPVLVDFWAPWCGPCRMFGPIFESVSEKITDVNLKLSLNNLYNQIFV